MPKSFKLGDLADEEAQRLQDSHIELVESEKISLEEESKSLPDRKKLFTKLEFRWSKSDFLILEQIRGACEKVVEEQLGSYGRILDELYEQSRVLKLNDSGLPARNREGRLVFEKDEFGNFIYDWSRVDGVQIESSIMRLAELGVEVSTKISGLLHEAIFARHIYDDEYQDSYRSLLDGTQGDRNAYAARESRQAKYFAFYKFCLWDSAERLQREIRNFQRVLERARDWQIRSQR